MEFADSKYEQTFMLRLYEFLCDMTDMREAYYKKQFSQSSDPLTYSIGKKYLKVFLLNRETGKPASVWCFVDSKGDIFKAASWSRPAKHARGNLWQNKILMGPYGPPSLK
jgi:hypothetical protein